METHLQFETLVDVNQNPVSRACSFLLYPTGYLPPCWM